MYKFFEGIIFHSLETSDEQPKTIYHRGILMSELCQLPLSVILVIDFACQWVLGEESRGRRIGATGEDTQRRHCGAV